MDQLTPVMVHTYHHVSVSGKKAFFLFIAKVYINLLTTLYPEP